ncbi:MAG: HDIG domain-containing protein [Tissierellia bacterium]|nr:HDIG domain-containing protein [Tissierellia bacterium]
MEKRKRKYNNLLPVTIMYLIALVLTVNMGRLLTTNQFLAGEKIKDAIYSIKDFKNTVREEQLKKEAAERVELVYKKIPQVPVNIREDMVNFFNELRKIRSNNTMDEETKVKTLIEGPGLTPDAGKAALNLSYQDTNYLEVIVMDLVSQWLAEGIREDAVDNIKTKATEALKHFNISEEQRLVGVELLYSLVIPNEIIDIHATAELQDEARAQIVPIEVKRGDMLFDKGHILTPADVEVLKLSGISNESQGMGRLKMITLSLGIIMISAAWYVVAKSLNLIDENVKTLSLLLILNWIMILLPFVLVKDLMWLWPIIAMVLLTRTLINEKAALLNICYLLIMYLFLFTVDVKYLVVMAFTGWLTVWLSENLSNYGRSRLMVLGLTASLLGGILLVVIEASKGSVGWHLWRQVVLLMVNGFISAIVYVGSLPLWENLFGRLTVDRLLELSNPRRPLLKELIEQAPGTYQHSIIVANLSEACAQAIGANSLLCRVGAYYHDIGKTKNPYYFKENQQDTSVHELMSFEDSARVIREHVTIGKRLAREHQLPQEIINFISEHHGDSLVRYFYNSAVNAGENPNPEDYSYPGPKPRSRETGIMMIVDAVEAAARTLEEKNEETFTELVDRLTRSKYEEGQFDDCPLTMRELAIVKSTLVESLTSMYHERIAYPEEMKIIGNTNRL